MRKRRKDYKASAMLEIYREECQNAVKNRIRLRVFGVVDLGACFDGILTFLDSYWAWLYAGKRNGVVEQ